MGQFQSDGNILRLNLNVELNLGFVCFINDLTNTFHANIFVPVHNLINSLAVQVQLCLCAHTHHYIEICICGVCMNV